LSLLEDLAQRRCEKSTDRMGCMGPTAEARPCDPCQARRELGLSPEAPRFCDDCGVRLQPHLAGPFIGVDGSTAHARDHKTSLFYDEFPKVGRR
jgi:hypothetical protein